MKNEIADRIAKEVVAREIGPVLSVLEVHWNRLHDIEYLLKETIHEYDMAASYADKAAVRDAKNMMKEIESVVRKLEQISTKEFSSLVKKEQEFVKKYGTPEDYVEKSRNEMFPI